MKTLYQLHVEKWKDCTQCPLHETRKHVVLARGAVPCDILLVGEGPGQSEDVLGLPFRGPAGHLLERLVREALAAARPPDQPPLRYAYSNLVACLPVDERGAKAGEPDPADIQACAPRLEEFVRLAEPKLIVCVGLLAEKWIMGTKGRKHILKDYTGKLVAIVHPAAIMRMTYAAQGLAAQRCVVTLTNAAEEIATGL